MTKSWKYLWKGMAFMLVTVNGFAQEYNARQDSSQWIQLHDVVVFANPHLQHLKQAKPLSSIDEYLEKSKAMHMIKRGAYAWEPNMNGMSSERLSVTIDGMQIFGACTDKMDPITSYVDVSNLSEAHVANGQSGNEYGNTIGGGLNLKLKQRQFVSKGWQGALEAGYESNNALKIGGANIGYSDKKFYFNSDVTYRDAENYSDGIGNEVLYSQFNKINTAVNAGFQLDSLQSFHGTFIYDKATDVGYPALTMDVSLAEAMIASLSYKTEKIGALRNWETKIYWNDITHVMDDTTRPDVPIHMDMPGWSTTYGGYTKADVNLDKHTLRFNLNAYLNQSLAEMTMYPNDPSENSMFMYTWPDVQTLNTAAYVADKFDVGQWEMEANMRLAYHANEVRNEFGLNSLKIFYPNIEASKDRFLKSFGLQTHRMFNHWHLNANIGYGERAPSVSEGYGFYLFNSFDNYDYVGNPELPTETSWEAALSLNYKQTKWNIEFSANTFYIQDYIIGKIDDNLAPMTIGASGIKIYQNIPSVNISNFNLASTVEITRSLDWHGQLSYHLGQDNDQNPLPLISPLSYQTSLEYYQKQWFANLLWKGALKQTEYNPSYGEDATPAYQVIDVAAGKTFTIDNQKLILKIGCQNLLNEQYSTYADWRNIPRMGRNFYIHAAYTFN